MKTRFPTLLLALAWAVPALAGPPGLTRGRPEIRSMSALAFGPEGVLFIGDGKGGAVFAVDLGGRQPRGSNEPVGLEDVEAKLAAALGATPADVMVHDLAVDPISQDAYLAVSRGRTRLIGHGELAGWILPNDVADANVLVRIDPAGTISVVDLDSVPFARAALPDPVDPAKTHMWKAGVSLRADTIVQMGYADGSLFVSGLSNEEFSSAVWRIPYPFASGITTTTVEIFHGAHGKYETHAPIRAFVPYRVGGKDELLAAYLCTPFVTFAVDELKDGAHVKGRTIGEFGSGSYPVDMVVYNKGDRDRILIANSNLPFLIVDPQDVASFQGEITAEPATYVAGVRHDIRSGTGIQQMALLNKEQIVALRREPSGTLDLVSYEVARF